MAKFKVEMIIEDSSFIETRNYTDENTEEIKDVLVTELAAVEIGVIRESIKIEKLED